jgi:hypothetical protein
MLGLRVRIPSRAPICLLWVLCVVRVLCYGPIICPEESYEVWCVCVWSWNLDNEEPWPTRGCCAMGPKSHLRGYKRTFQCFRQQIFLQILDRLITAKNTTSILKTRFRIARFRGTALLLAVRKKTRLFGQCICHHIQARRKGDAYSPGSVRER